MLPYLFFYLRDPATLLCRARRLSVYEPLLLHRRIQDNGGVGKRCVISKLVVLLTF